VQSGSNSRSERSCRVCSYHHWDEPEWAPHKRVCCGICILLSTCIYVHCRCHGYGTLSLVVYSLIIYVVVGVCHHESGSAMDLIKTSAQWESCRRWTAHVGEWGGGSWSEWSYLYNLCLRSAVVACLAFVRASHSQLDFLATHNTDTLQLATVFSFNSVATTFNLRLLVK